MADRWTDERDREQRDRDWQRSERFGRGQSRDQDYGQQGFEGAGGDREGRTFDPRGGYDDDRGYDLDRSYSSGSGAEDRGYGEGGFGGRGYGGGAQSDRNEFGARFSGPDRDQVFGERESGDNYRGGATYSGADYGRSSGGSQSGGGQQYGAYGSQGSQGGQREYGRGGEHFGQAYGQQTQGRGSDYRAGGRFYGDDAREPIYREEYGQGGRDHGPVPGGYEAPQWRGGAETYGGRSQGWRGRDHDDHSPPNVREGRGEGGRSWWDRAKNQVASFFGDEDAERRTEWDRQTQGAQTQGHRGRGPKGYKRSDERISEEVHRRLTDDPWVDATHIEVEVKNCEVTLSGNVSDREERRRAERCVEDIWGVTHVQNNLRVQQNQGQGLSGDNPREGAGSMLGRGSSDTSSNNPITGTGHGFGDNMLAAGDPAAAGAASLTDAGSTGQAGQSGTTTAGSATTSTGAPSTNKDRK
ncbi:BON domain-containing protein [Phenylobacterium sp.]|uniref:BON domain-containing protein n=1 Tax=Phenylobacterium sp. TaxID=1871053 RepID=UPI002E2F2D88|nr:BON domain-containing protein [Phenylobacterium sp.]HEX2562008.1 BON domain-containing protein [Phenylobacterium sp.]